MPETPALDLDPATGWCKTARRCPSPNFNARPAGVCIDLLVIHGISLPAGHYGGPFIEALFLNQLDPHAHASFADLRDLRVSAHFLIRRDGALVQFVSTDDRAWHAGVSSFEGRSGCNDFRSGSNSRAAMTSHTRHFSTSDSLDLPGCFARLIRGLRRNVSWDIAISRPAAKRIRARDLTGQAIGPALPSPASLLQASARNSLVVSN